MIEAVILYSTNDYKFFKICIDNLLKCGINCHIMTYSHMWNGEDEDTELLNKSIDAFKDNKNVNFYKIEWELGNSPWYWEGMGRYLGTTKVDETSDYILYIDIDEIVDPEKFNSWITTDEYKKYDVLKLSTHWYWREPIYQAHQTEDSVVMIKASLAKQLEFKMGGREVYFNSSHNGIRNVSQINPLIHHYSWVRTKNEMLSKVANWGHSSDRGDWKLLIEEEFGRPFNGTDFLHNYTYNIVENKFNL